MRRISAILLLSEAMLLGLCRASPGYGSPSGSGEYQPQQVPEASWNQGQQQVPGSSWNQGQQQVPGSSWNQGQQQGCQPFFTTTTIYSPQYATVTSSVTQYHSPDRPQYQTIYTTQYNTISVTQSQQVPVYVTSTQAQTLTKTKKVVSYITQFVPTYVTQFVQSSVFVTQSCLPSGGYTSAIVDGSGGYGYGYGHGGSHRRPYKGSYGGGSQESSYGGSYSDGSSSNIDIRFGSADQTTESSGGGGSWSWSSLMKGVGDILKIDSLYNINKLNK
ncbi:uncharacterized protein LOC135226163 [Macrobrachium nipponense]|uniref:uncharacterized protein LOC135226163 n=1 Tax=Macrobrachium nipponense TaxID=159736 RepID=UPI0030C8795F